MDIPSKSASIKLPKGSSLIFSRGLKGLQAKLTLIVLLVLMSGLIITPEFVSITAFADSTVQKEALRSEYEKRKQEINQKIGSIGDKQKEIDSQNTQNQAQVSALGEKSDQLSQEVDLRRKDIDNVQVQIVGTQVVIEQINSQVKSNEAQLEVIQNQVKDMLIEMQKQDRVTPLQTILASKSISEMFTKVFNLGTVQDQANILSKKIQDTQEELNRNEQMQIDIQSQLESTKALLKSKQDSLQNLLAQTKGEQAKYEELLKQQQEQLKQLQEQQAQARQQLDKAGVEYISEVQQVEESERAKIAAINQQAQAIYGAGRISNIGSRPGYQGCSFESDGLSVPKGFFIQPTTGYLTQGFTCGHDGLDIANGVGTPIYSIGNGIVVKKTPGVPASCWGWTCNSGFGNAIFIQYTVPSGQSLVGVYVHMNYESPLRVGDSVGQGQQVGAIGNTGNSFGAHLHFMMIANDLNRGGACRYGGAKCYNPIRYIG